MVSHRLLPLLIFLVAQGGILLGGLYWYGNGLTPSDVPVPSRNAIPGASSKKDLEIKKLRKQLQAKEDLLNAWTVTTDQSVDFEDPDFLDDRLVLEGFAGAPLTISSAQLCDEKWTILLRGSWKCPSDSSCMACRGDSMSKFDKLLSAFRGDSGRENRFLSSVEHFGVAGQRNSSMIVLMAVNYGQLYLFLNWACSCYRLGIDPKRIAMVVPTDTKAAKVLQSQGFYTVSTDWIKKLDRPISTKYSGAANTGGHSDINNIVLLAANELVQGGYQVIIHDVDIVWKKDVRSWLKRAGKRRDLLGMIAPYWDVKGVVNSGFVYIRPTTKGKILMQSLENLAPLKQNSDQELWNTVLRHLYLRQVAFRILPQALFYKYSGHRAHKPTESVLVYHAVGNSKRFHMKFHEMWFFSSSCPYYDQTVDEASGNVQERTKW